MSTARIRIATQIGSLVEPLVSADTFNDFKAGFASALRMLKVHSADLDNNGDPATHIRMHIDTHFADPQLNVNSLGESVELSPSYVSKLFRNRYGVSPLEYLGRTRIAHAKTLLISTRMSVEEITVRSGFLSSSVFIRTFKREEGHTPGNYRTLYKKL